MKQIKTASEFFAENNGGKSPEECTNDGVTITPAWAVKLMQTYAQQFKPEWTAVEDWLPEEWKEVLVLVEGYNDPIYAYYVEGKWYVSVPLGVMIEGCLGSKEIGGIVTHYLEIQLPNRPY